MSLMTRHLADTSRFFLQAGFVSRDLAFYALNSVLLLSSSA